MKLKILLQALLILVSHIYRKALDFPSTLSTVLEAAAKDSELSNAIANHNAGLTVSYPRFLVEVS